MYFRLFVTISADGKGAKSTDRGAYIVTASIVTNCARDICIDNTCAMGTWIRYAGIGGIYTGGIYAKSAFVRGIETRVLAGLKITLAELGGIDFCF